MANLLGTGQGTRDSYVDIYSRSIDIIRDALVRFVTFATRPSWIALSVALAIVSSYAVTVSTANFRVLSKVLEIYPGIERLPENFYVFSRLTSFLSIPANPEKPTFVFIGGSTARESVWDEVYMEAKIAEAGGGSTEFIDLSLGGGHLIETWSAAEPAACHGASRIVFAISLGRMRKYDNVSRVGYALDDADDLLVAAGVINENETHRAPNGPNAFVSSGLELAFWFAAQDLFGYRHTTLRKLPKGNGRHRHIDQKPLSPKRFLRKLTQANIKHLNAETPPERLVAFLDVMRTSLAKCGADLVLFDTPVNPILLQAAEWPEYSQAHDRYLEVVQAYADEAGIPFLVANDNVAYRVEDFADWGHLGSAAAIKRTSDYLARELADISAAQRGESQ